MDVFVMDKVMKLVRLYVSIFKSLKALAFKHVPCPLSPRRGLGQIFNQMMGSSPDTLNIDLFSCHFPLTASGLSIISWTLPLWEESLALSGSPSRGKMNIERAEG